MKMLDYFLNKLTHNLPDISFDDLKLNSDLKIDCSESGLDTLGVALLYHQYHNLNLSEDSWRELLNLSDCQHNHLYGNNLLLALDRTLPPYIIEYLIDHSDICVTNSKGENALHLLVKTKIEIAQKYKQIVVTKSPIDIDNLSLIIKNNNYLNIQNVEHLIEGVDSAAVDSEGRSIAMLVFGNNKKLNIPSKKIDDLIKNTDLNQTNNYGHRCLNFALAYNKEQNLNLSAEQLDYLIKNSDLQELSADDFNSLMVALRHNKCENLNLSSEQFDCLIKNSDLKKFSSDGWNSLMVALRHNKRENLNLSSEQFYFLIKNSNLQQVNKDGCNSLMLALRCNTEENLKLSSEQLDILLCESQLNQINKDGQSVLAMALIYSPSLNNAQLEKLIDKDIDPLKSLSKIKSADVREDVIDLILQKIGNSRHHITSLLESNRLSKKQVKKWCKNLIGDYTKDCEYTVLSVYLKQRTSENVLKSIVMQEFSTKELAESNFRVLSAEKLQKILKYIPHDILFWGVEVPDLVQQHLEKKYFTTNIEQCTNTKKIMKI